MFAINLRQAQSRAVLQALSRRQETIAVRRSSDFVAKFSEQLVKSASRPKDLPVKTRLASKLLSDADVSSSEYMRRIESRVNLDQSLDDLEQELNQEIAFALKRSETNLLCHMDVLSRLSDMLNSRRNSLTIAQQQEIVEAFNEAREAAVQARQYLIIHRQAVGFKVQNYQQVMERYPIPAPLKL